jgi:hypothetical protein
MHTPIKPYTTLIPLHQYYIHITLFSILKDLEILIPKYSTYLDMKNGSILLKIILTLTHNSVTVIIYLFQTTWWSSTKIKTCSGIKYNHSKLILTLLSVLFYCQVLLCRQPLYTMTKYWKVVAYNVTTFIPSLMEIYTLWDLRFSEMYQDYCPLGCVSVSEEPV